MAGEDLGVFVNRAVLDNRRRLGHQVHVEPEFVAQEADLGMKTPLLHVEVEVLQVRIEEVGLDKGAEAVGLAEEVDEGGLPNPDVPRDGDELARLGPSVRHRASLAAPQSCCRRLRLGAPWGGARSCLTLGR